MIVVLLLAASAELCAACVGEMLSARLKKPNIYVRLPAPRRTFVQFAAYTGVGRVAQIIHSQGSGFRVRQVQGQLGAEESAFVRMNTASDVLEAPRNPRHAAKLS